jgi:hypothetical protein
LLVHEHGDADPQGLQELPVVEDRPDLRFNRGHRSRGRAIARYIGSNRFGREVIALAEPRILAYRLIHCRGRTDPAMAACGRVAPSR